MLVLNNLQKKFTNSKMVLNNVNAKFRSGSINCIVGVNGAGKTTLLNIISSILMPTKGDVYLNSESIFENSTLKKEIFYTPVNPFFYENLSAKDNLYLICSLYNRKIDQITIEKTIKDVGLNIEDLNIPVYNFSSGMKQKLNFASMLLVDSNVLLLDEPFNALDHVAQKNFTRILKGIVSKEKIIIFTSHLPNTILELSENIYLLKDGCFTDKRKAQSFNQTTLETWLLESQKEVIPYEEK